LENKVFWLCYLLVMYTASHILINGTHILGMDAIEIVSHLIIIFIFFLFFFLFQLKTMKP